VKTLVVVHLLKVDKILIQVLIVLLSELVVELALLTVQVIMEVLLLLQALQQFHALVVVEVVTNNLTLGNLVDQVVEHQLQPLQVQEHQVKDMLVQVVIMGRLTMDQVEVEQELHLVPLNLMEELMVVME
jgi:hypothetical protein